MPPEIWIDPVENLKTKCDFLMTWAKGAYLRSMKSRLREIGMLA
jgi:hypothetical protein